MQRPPKSLTFVIPHAVTFLRLPLAGAFFVLFRPQETGALLACAALLAAAALTDYLDGMLARRLGTVGTFGKWADPLCDAVFFLAVYAAFQRAGLTPLVLVLLFALRESLQYGVVRPLAMRRHIDPGARTAGKVKTGLQIAGTASVIIATLAGSTGSLTTADVRGISTAVVSVLVAVSLGSMYWYVLPLIGPPPRGRLAANIIATAAVYLAANAAAVVGAAKLFASPPPPPAFLAGLGLYHALVTAFLLLRRSDLAADGARAPEKLNLATHLTLVRLSSAPAFAFFVATLHTPAAAPVLLSALSLVFLTDLVDGKVARARGEVTFMGRYLDPVSDYVLLFATVIAASATGAASPWYLAAFLARFALFPAGMALLSVRRGRVEPESTLWGKVAVFATMATLAFQLCRALGVPVLGYPRLVTGLEAATACILAVSLVDKVLYLVPRLRGK